MIQDILKYGCCMGGVSDHLPHFLQLALELFHSSEVCYDRLTLSHIVVLVFLPDDADLAWISGFEFLDQYLSCFTCHIHCLNRCLEFW